ncbi:histidinol dehydrogenase [Lacticaseibacillus casei]|jgi:histidinol dehydrogenase|uniref:Histidinol dehydrogenase n=1 Tax=Lacticaseibacillus huelsenbergensis TaxID=3035291 RepID=A0ABY8DPN5_9LACO|nr:MULTISPECIES: histidinol dehydrogenase [Lacticaseibacillus]MDG3061746.1 histidinol dehydrogenase [Lacticaseibacillus sp. BCRC 81376]QVI37801.1 histidinol dehydrogenase [Lacticaseibacillus casei]QXG59592.1 histidinol dehydrogenase [Lacticaseibacillus casei]WFB38944.1 histidinol dehydrogenase [Lacticaseibacillus huelsenbergensis]WFB43338.1 histidinol dehydrogenase [Lacticaseibacillus huelsenbergensis]
MKILTGTLTQLQQQVAAREQNLTQNTAVQTTVQEILANVKAKGDAALRNYSKQLDHVSIDDLRVPQATIDAALANLSPKLLTALNLAKTNITSYHQLEISHGFIDSPSLGIIRGQKVTPLDAVGLYVPGGTAAYPSTILMTAIPAKLAGVKKIVMVTPPQKAGLNPVVLAAAKLAGIDEIYQIGGAQAIGALAFGTETIPRVDKIMGPGNQYVAEAKKQVFGAVAIDMIAGPSEIGIIADDSANPVRVAADLLSQAEHDPNARAMLVTPSEKLAEAVSDQVEIQLATLPRAAIARTAIRNQGFIAVVTDTNAAFTLMNTIAPEHLEVQLPDPITYLNRIQHAGSVFLGENAAEPVGDYVAGPNHVLPTAGSARFFSPLGVYDFVKRTQFIQYSSEALARQADAIVTLARTEGLDGHAEAILKRTAR